MTLIKKLFSFSLVGGVITILSLSLNVLLLKYLDTPLVPTYIFIYLTTIGISYLLNSRLTFKSSIHGNSALMYFGSYIFTMCLGSLLYVFIPMWIILEKWYYPFLVIPFTSIVNFLLANKILKRAP